MLMVANVILMLAVVFVGIYLSNLFFLKRWQMVCQALGEAVVTLTLILLLMNIISFDVQVETYKKTIDKHEVSIVISREITHLISTDWRCVSVNIDELSFSRADLSLIPRAVVQEAVSSVEQKRAENLALLKQGLKAER